MNIEVHDDARFWACVLMLGIVAVGDPMTEWEMRQGIGDELHIVPAHEANRHWLGRGCYCQPRLDGLIWHHREIPAEMPGSTSVSKTAESKDRRVCLRLVPRPA